MPERGDLATLVGELAAMRPRRRGAILAALPLEEREVVRRLLRPADESVASVHSEPEWGTTLSPWLLARIAPDAGSQAKARMTVAATEALRSVAQAAGDAEGAAKTHAPRGAPLLSVLMAKLIPGRRLA